MLVIKFMLPHKARDPRTPLAAKLLAAFVAAYALSPIDLIPDFIPVLGFLDDALLLPIGIWLTLKFIPKPVLADCREKAGRRKHPANEISAGGTRAKTSGRQKTVIIAEIGRCGNAPIKKASPAQGRGR